MDSFRDRILKVMAGREQKTWGDNLGLKKSRVSNMCRGMPPTSDALTAISRAENVSIDWLLTGRGRPYHVRTSLDDEATAEDLAEHLDESWTITVAQCPHPGRPPMAAIILTQPATYRMGERDIAYTALVVIAGVIGPKTRALLGASASDHDLQALDLDAETLRRLIDGELGAYAIALADNALLRQARPLVADETESRVAEPGNDYTPHGAGAVSQEEWTLIEKYRALSREDRTRMQAIVDALDAAGRGSEATRR